MTTLSISISSELEAGRLTELFATSSSQDHEALLELSKYFAALASGHASGVVKVASSATAPVQASGTWTLASVVATDACTVGATTFTFTSTPSLSTDVEVDVPSAKAFASATDISTVTGLILESSHGYATGDVGQLTTSSALPTGFALSTDYYVIAISANSYKLASSLANAQAGIPIIPTAVGTGNQTFTLKADSYTAKQLAAAVNAHSTASKLVTATYDGSAVVTVTANQAGDVGNLIAFSDADTTITSSGSGYLAGGTGGAQSTPIVFTR